MTEQDTPKMTHDEMIDVLKGLVFGTFDRTTAKEREALDMAISILSAPSANVISIDQANAMIKSYVSHYEGNEELRENIEKAKAEIVALPKTYPFVNHIDTYVKEDDVLHILDNIGKAESDDIDPNDISHIFDGVTEIPKDAFKGWYTDSAPLKDCKNPSESYGEICVKCNKCGRFDKHIGKAESEDKK